LGNGISEIGTYSGLENSAAISLENFAATACSNAISPPLDHNQKSPANLGH
jgi:hypothetical protein